MSASEQTGKNPGVYCWVDPDERMIRSSHILCFSRNPVLLETRSAVLAKQYLVVAVRSLEEMVHIPRTTPFDVVLLCHTLSAAECEAGTEIARHRWPGSKILTLTSGEARDNGTRADADVSSLEGPRALLRAIQDVMRESHVSGNSASI